MIDKWHKTTNEDGEAEYHPKRDLCGHCTLFAFKSMSFSKAVYRNGKALKVDDKSHTISLNDGGRCTVEQFGSLAIAREIFTIMREQL